MKNIKYLLLAFVIVSCANDKTPKLKIDFDCSGFQKSNENLNINILLDLSDRINPNTNPNQAMDYFKRDIGYIHQLVKIFNAILLIKNQEILMTTSKYFLNLKAIFLS